MAGISARRDAVPQNPHHEKSNRARTRCEEQKENRRRLIISRPWTWRCRIDRNYLYCPNLARVSSKMPVLAEWRYVPEHLHSYSAGISHGLSFCIDIVVALIWPMEPEWLLRTVPVRKECQLLWTCLKRAFQFYFATTSSPKDKGKQTYYCNEYNHDHYSSLCPSSHSTL